MKVPVVMVQAVGGDMEGKGDFEEGVGGGSGGAEPPRHHDPEL